jgi:predicted nucleotidyltransferase
MVAIAKIQNLANCIAEQFRPEKIILFGSYARGNPTPDSDIDLLVVLPHKGKSWRLAAQIRGALQADYPLDLIVRSPEELRRRLAEGDPFLLDIEKNGEVLYENRNP